jgi:hypothetical protein
VCSEVDGRIRAGIKVPLPEKSLYTVSLVTSPIVRIVKLNKNRAIFWIFLYVVYSTLLRLPALRFHCVGRCWDGTQDCCGFGIESQTL